MSGPREATLRHEIRLDDDVDDDVQHHLNETRVALRCVIDLISRGMVYKRRRTHGSRQRLF
jgi:hypothetical protein